MTLLLVLLLLLYLLLLSLCIDSKANWPVLKKVRTYSYH